MDVELEESESSIMMLMPPAASSPRSRGRTMRRTLRRLASRFTQQEAGQDLVEYGLLVAFIALTAAAAMHNVESGIIRAFTSVSTSLTAPF